MNIQTLIKQLQSLRSEFGDSLEVKIKAEGYLISIDQVYYEMDDEGFEDHLIIIDTP